MSRKGCPREEQQAGETTQTVVHQGIQSPGRRAGPPAGNTAGSVARDLDLTETAVRDWVKQADIDDGRREGLTTAEREELVRLRRENRVLREERDILKRAEPVNPIETRGVRNY